MGPESRTERPSKTKIGREVAHVTDDSATTFEVKKSKVNLQGREHIAAAFGTSRYIRVTAKTNQAYLYPCLTAR